MKIAVVKAYIYLLFFASIIGVISSATYYLSKGTFIKIFTIAFSTLEIQIFFISAVMIFYLLKNKVRKAYVLLPAFYVIFYLILLISGTAMFFAAKARGLPPYEATSNTLTFVTCIIFYFFQIALGIYLLRKINTIKEVHKRKIQSSNEIGTASTVLGAISIIPLFAFFTGVIAIFLGITAVMDNKSKKLGVLGLTLAIIGIAVSVVLSSYIYTGISKFGDVISQSQLESVRKTDLPETINILEAYKARYGNYPTIIEELWEISGNEYVVIDRTQLSKSNKKFYYEDHGDYYYLFSKGPDGRPFTSDDIFPEVNGDPLSIGYRRPGINTTKQYLPIPGVIEVICKQICYSGGIGFDANTAYVNENDSYSCTCVHNSKIVKRQEFKDAMALGAIRDILELNQTRVYTISGIDYELTVSSVTHDLSGTIFNINGEYTDILTEGQDYKLIDGTMVGLNAILFDAETGNTSVYFYLVGEALKKTNQNATNEIFAAKFNQSGCGFFFDVNEGKTTLLNSEFENNDYYYKIHDAWRNQYDQVKEKFPGESYYSFEGKSMQAYYNGEPVTALVWSMTEETDYTLEKFKDKWTDGIRANEDRDFSGVPPMEFCKDFIASGEEAYFIKSNFYRESTGLNYNRYDVITVKKGKAYTVTVNFGYLADFEEAEKDLDLNQIGRDIIRSLKLK